MWNRKCHWCYDDLLVVFFWERLEISDNETWYSVPVLHEDIVRSIELSISEWKIIGFLIPRNKSLVVKQFSL